MWPIWRGLNELLLPRWNTIGPPRSPCATFVSNAVIPVSTARSVDASMSIPCKRACITGAASSMTESPIAVTGPAYVRWRTDRRRTAAVREMDGFAVGPATGAMVEVVVGAARVSAVESPRQLAPSVVAARAAIAIRGAADRGPLFPRDRARRSIPSFFPEHPGSRRPQSSGSDIRWGRLARYLVAPVASAVGRLWKVGGPSAMEWALLESLSEADRRAVLTRCRRQRYSRNEVVFREGEIGDSVHLLAKGTVAVRVATPSG